MGSEVPTLSFHNPFWKRGFKELPQALWPVNTAHDFLFALMWELNYGRCSCGEMMFYMNISQAPLGQAVHKHNLRNWLRLNWKSLDFVSNEKEKCS